MDYYSKLAEDLLKLAEKYPGVIIVNRGYGKYLDRIKEAFESADAAIHSYNRENGTNYCCIVAFIGRDFLQKTLFSLNSGIPMPNVSSFDSVEDLKNHFPTSLLGNSNKYLNSCSTFGLSEEDRVQLDAHFGRKCHTIA